MAEWQRCKGCGKKWRRYEPTSLTALPYLLAMLPIWWWHFHFGCKKVSR